MLTWEETVALSVAQPQQESRHRCAACPDGLNHLNSEQLRHPYRYLFGSTQGRTKLAVHSSFVGSKLVLATVAGNRASLETRGAAMRRLVLPFLTTIVFAACEMPTEVPTTRAPDSFAPALDLDTDPSLVGHWKFDEGSGTVAVDASGSGNSGTLMNGPIWVSGHTGNANEWPDMGFRAYWNSPVL
jgi:hypothetical protein